MKPDIAYGPEFVSLKVRIEKDELPEQKARFAEFLNRNLIIDMASFSTRLDEHDRNIQTSIEEVNRSLKNIDFSPGTFIEIARKPTSSHEVNSFRSDLRNCLRGAINPEKEDERIAIFQNIRKLICQFSAIWDGLLSVCEYFLAHPRPGLYARQLPIPVHTKFVSENRHILTSMLERLLPPEAKAEGHTFEDRFGLKPLEPLIRFRVLDPTMRAGLGFSHERMGLPLEIFGSLRISGLTVIITENLMNIECLPLMEKGMAIFGQGNAAELLQRVGWLEHCKVYYWGDVDEHGFHILARLRKRFSNLRSLNMDITTLERFRHLTGKGENAGKEPTNLTETESAAFRTVERENLRLEQEKIPQEYALSILQKEGLRVALSE